MFSTPELLTLFNLEHKELRWRDYFTKLQNESPEEVHKLKILDYISVKKYIPADLVLKLALLDGRLLKICLDPSLDAYWHEFIRKIVFNHRGMEPQMDIIPFYQAFALYAYAKSTLLTGAKKDQWEAIALRFDSWHMATGESRKEGNQLFSLSLSEALPIARKMVERANKIAILHFTPGFFLLADVYNSIAACFDSHAERFHKYYQETQLSGYKNYFDLFDRCAKELYRCALEALCFARSLLTLPQSIIAWKNAARGDNFLQQHFEFNSIEEAEAHLSKKLTPDLCTRATLDATCKALLFQSYRLSSRPEDLTSLTQMKSLLPSLTPPA